MIDLNERALTHEEILAILAEALGMTTEPEAPQEDDDTIIISPKPMMVFTCQHCSAKFKTRNWRRTRGRHYSADCPCCLYAAWTR